MKFSLRGIFAAGAFVTALWSSAANAQLTKSDFLTKGDGFLITDQVTGLQWLSPYATRNMSINQIVSGNGLYGSGNLLTTYGFSYASTSEVISMINGNFDDPSVPSDMNHLSSLSGSAAGYSDAADFFNVFGLNELITCNDGSGWSPCPRTQGFALDGTEVSQIGMAQWGSNGFILDFDVGSTSDGYWLNNADTQLGSWLVRSVAGPLPEPSTWALMLLGFGAVGAAMRRNRRTDRLPQLA